MYDNSEDHSWSFAAGLFVGALIGAGAASLFTPRSGPQNREMVREKSLVLKDRVSDVATSTTTKVSDASSTVTERVSAVAATVADRASGAVATVQEAATTAATKVSDVASTATEKVSDTASAAAAKVSEVASTATEKARDLTGRTPEVVADTPSMVVAEAPLGAAEISTETLRIGSPTGSDIANRVPEPATDVFNIEPMAPASIAVESDTTATIYDTDTNMLITDTSDIEMNDAAQALESDEQFEVNPATNSQGARAYVASNESGSGEVRGTGESNQT